MVLDLKPPLLVWCFFQQNILELTLYNLPNKFGLPTNNTLYVKSKVD